MSSESKLVFRESPWEQSIYESRVYKLTVPASWGSNPVPTAVTVIRRSDNADVTADVVTGSASVLDQVITTPLIADLEATAYILKIRFTVDGGSELEPYGRLMGIDPNAA